MIPGTQTRHAWLVRLSALTAFVLSLGWASSAFAVAPMCGPRAQSIAAPPIGTPTSTDSLSAAPPCQLSNPLLASSVPQREAPEKLSFPDSPIRALPVLSRVAQCPEAARASTAAAEQDLLATGFARSIDRPPRA